MAKSYLILFASLFLFTFEGSGYYSGNFDFAHGLRVKTDWLTDKKLNLDITIRIETSECIGDANIGVYLMREKFLDDEIICRESIKNKVGVYDVSLSAEKDNNENEHKYYVYLENHCGFTATGSIYIEYDY